MVNIGLKLVNERLPDSSPFLYWPKLNLFSKQAEMGVMAKQTQHDEICVQTIEAVSDIGIIVRLGLW